MLAIFFDVAMLSKNKLYLGKYFFISKASCRSGNIDCFILLTHKKIEMKKFLLSFLMIAAVSSLIFAQEAKKATKKAEVTAKEVANPNGPKMELETLDIDYGTIEKNADPFRTVKFTNTGKEPLIIKSARGNCGCTVPTWPREAIMPGETKEIKIRYATNRIGPFHKKVTLVTNEATDNKHIIKIHGKVLKPDDTKGVPEGKPSMLKEKK